MMGEVRRQRDEPCRSISHAMPYERPSRVNRESERWEREAWSEVREMEATKGPYLIPHITHDVYPYEGPFGGGITGQKSTYESLSS